MGEPPPADVSQLGRDDGPAGTRRRPTDIVRATRRGKGPLLPILHALQDAFGYVPPRPIPFVAEALNLSRAEVHGVVTFYHDFRQEPAGRHVLKLCRAEACQSMGGEALAARGSSGARRRLRRDHAGRPRHVEAIYCLGLCAARPSAMLDGEPIGRLDAATARRARCAEARR